MHYSHIPGEELHELIQARIVLEILNPQTQLFWNEQMSSNVFIPFVGIKSNVVISRLMSNKVGIYNLLILYHILTEV